MSAEITLEALSMVTSCSPTQWFGVAAGGAEVYIRYRFGHLTMEINGETERTVLHGHEYDGTMDTAEMLLLLGIEHPRCQACEGTGAEAPVTTRIFQFRLHCQECSGSGLALHPEVPDAAQRMYGF